MIGNLNIALIGAGGIGTRWARVIQRVKEVSLRAICDINGKRAKDLAFQFKKCDNAKNWKDLVKRKDIDVVIVALPHVFLAPVTTAFLRSGKHVLCEKPGGVDTFEIKKALKAAKRNRVCYMVGFNHRYHDGFLKARTLFKKGEIGDILFIRARYGFGGRKRYAKEWRFDKKVSGGGQLIDQGVHMIDLARWFLGDFAHIRGFSEDMFWRGGVEDNAFLLLKNKKGQIASIHASWTQWNPSHLFEIYGTKGYLVIRGLGRKYNGGEDLIFGKRDMKFKSLPQEKIISCDSDADNSLVKELEEFVSAIHEKREPQPNGNDAFEALKIVHKIYAEKK